VGADIKRRSTLRDCQGRILIANQVVGSARDPKFRGRSDLQYHPKAREGQAVTGG